MATSVVSLVRAASFLYVLDELDEQEWNPDTILCVGLIIHARGYDEISAPPFSCLLLQLALDFCASSETCPNTFCPLADVSFKIDLEPLPAPEPPVSNVELQLLQSIT